MRERLTPDSSQIPTTVEVAGIVGFSFPLPCNGQLRRESVDMSSEASKAVLSLFWSTFLRLWRDTDQETLGPVWVVLHRHGQKERMQTSGSPGRTYVHCVDEVIDWAHVKWVALSVGAVRRPTSVDNARTILADRALNPSVALLTQRAKPFSVGGSRAHCNFQSDGPVPLALSESGEQVFAQLASSSGCETLNLIRSLLYSEFIHVSRSPTNPTHHFDYHR